MAVVLFQCSESEKIVIFLAKSSGYRKIKSNILANVWLG